MPEVAKTKGCSIVNASNERKSKPYPDLDGYPVWGGQ
jgi:hypothetical protein